MKIFILPLFLMMAINSWASFEEEMTQASEKLRKDLMDARVKSDFTGSYPNMRFVQESGKVLRAYDEKVLEIHQTYCAQDSSKCLTEKDINLRKSKTNIAIGLIEKKDQWSRENRT